MAVQTQTRRTRTDSAARLQAAHGHAWRTLVRARRVENITVHKLAGLHGPRVWSLPSNDDRPSPSTLRVG